MTSTTSLTEIFTNIESYNFRRVPVDFEISNVDLKFHTLVTKDNVSFIYYKMVKSKLFKVTERGEKESSREIKIKNEFQHVPLKDVFNAVRKLIASGYKPVNYKLKDASKPQESTTTKKTRKKSTKKGSSKIESILSLLTSDDILDKQYYFFSDFINPLKDKYFEDNVEDNDSIKKLKGFIKDGVKYVAGIESKSDIEIENDNIEDEIESIDGYKALKMERHIFNKDIKLDSLKGFTTVPGNSTLIIVDGVFYHNSYTESFMTSIVSVGDKNGNPLKTNKFIYINMHREEYDGSFISLSVKTSLSSILNHIDDIIGCDALIYESNGEYFLSYIEKLL